MINQYRNMKIQNKLIGAFVIIAILASLSGAISTVMMKGISNEYDDILVNHGFAQGDIGKALAAFCGLDRNVRDSVNCLDDRYANGAYEAIPKLKEEFEQQMERVEPTLASQAAKETYTQVMSAWLSYQRTAIPLADKGRKTDDPQLVEFYQKELNDKLNPLYRETYEGLRKIMEIKVEVGNEGRTDAAGLLSMSVLITAGILTGALILAIFLGRIIASGIAKPMALCCSRLTQLSEGDLQSEVPELNRTDELGQLAETTGVIVDMLNQMIGDIGYLLGEMADGNFDLQTRNEQVYQGDLQKILTSIRKINRNLSETLLMLDQSAEQVACGAEQVSTGAQVLAQGAAEQASAVEELSATTEEIEQSAKKNAENSEKAMEHARQAETQIELSSASMGKMVSAMADITEASEQIARIIATIENIAFQTNILALNAAIEAARAGAAGKGFTVVADEVRELASKSDEAAKATKALIENAIGAVHEGERTLEEVSATLSCSVEHTGQVMEDIQAIYSAAAAQSQAIEQVAAGIEQISSVVQTNSATSEESAAASEELSGQAELMKEKMSRFKLRSTVQE